jgi:hypothetical protein
VDGAIAETAVELGSETGVDVVYKSRLTRNVARWGSCCRAALCSHQRYPELIHPRGNARVSSCLVEVDRTKVSSGTRQ